MGAFWPHDGPAVTPGNQHEALPGGGGTVVSRHQFPMFNGIAKILQLLFPTAEGLASQFLDGLALADRPPCLELLHILQHDDSGADSSSPPQDDPCQSTNIPVYRSGTLGLGKMLTVRAEPCQTDGAPPTDFHRINIPDGCLEVFGKRVICPVEQDGIRIMVDGNSHRPTRRQFDPRGSTAATGEIVHDDLIKYMCLHD